MNCPECQQTFIHGWAGIDAHWRSVHEHVMPYEEARLVHGFAPNVHPIVTPAPLTDTKHDGDYRLTDKGHSMHHLPTPHNDVSWQVIRFMLIAYGVIAFWDLCVAVRHHNHGDKSKQGKGPQSFVRYLKRLDLIEQV